MSAEQKLREAITKLKSSKRKERQEALHSILVLVNNELIVNYLNAKCHGNDTITWTVLFIRAHNAVLDLIGTTRNGATLPKATLALTHDALQLVVTKSRGLIDAQTFVSYSLAVFENSTHRDALGAVYLDMLACNFQSSRGWSRRLQTIQWGDLLDLCINQYASPPPNGNSTKILDLLAKMVDIGVRHSLSSHALASILPFLSNIYSNLRLPSSTLEWNLLQLTYSSLKALMINNRQKVVVFTEEIYDNLAALYFSGKEKNKLIFQIMLVAVHAHQPQGVEKSHPASLALNWERWKKIVGNMFALCSTEFNELLRKREKVDLSDDFMELLVHLTYLVYMIDDCRETIVIQPESATAGCSGMKRKSIDTYISQTQKKARFTTLTWNILKLLQDLTPFDHPFWLPYITKVVKTHPKILQEDYCNVVQIICKSLLDSGSSYGYFARLAVALLKVEKKLPSGLLNSTQLSNCWKSLSDMVLKNLKKDDTLENHLILQTLLSESKIEDHEPYLDLYMSCSFSVNAINIDTLLCLIEKKCVLDRQDRRIKLFNWCCQSQSLPSNLPTVISLLLFGKMNTSSVPILPAHHLTDIYYELSFKKLRQLSSSSKMEVTDADSIFNEVVEVFFNWATVYCHKLVEKLQLCEHNALVQAVNFCKILNTSLSSFNEENCYSLQLVQLIKAVLSALNSAVNNTVLNHILPLRQISQLYKMEVCNNVNVLIRENTSLTFVSSIFKIFQSQLDNTFEGKLEPCNLESDMEQRNELTDLLRNLNLSEKCILHPQSPGVIDNYLIDVTQFLLDFINATDEPNKNQLILKRKVVTVINEYLANVDIEQRPHLQMVLQVVFQLGLSKHTDAEFGGICLNILSTIFEKTGKDVEITAACMCVLSQIHVVKDVAKTEYLQLILKCQTLIKPHSPALLIQQYLACICEISDGTEDITLDLPQIVVDYLTQKSIHVRLSAAYAFGQLYAKNNDFNFQKHACDCLRRALNCLTPSDDYDSSMENRPFFVAVAYMFISKSEFREKTLFLIVQMILTLRLDQETVKNFASLISNELGLSSFFKYIKCHLFKVLTIVMLGKYSLEDFLSRIMECEEEKNIFSNYLDIIVSALLCADRFAEIDSLAIKLKTSVVIILQKCSATVVAHYLMAEIDDQQRMWRYLEKYTTVNNLFLSAQECVDVTLYHLTRAMDVDKGFQPVADILKKIHPDGSFFEYIVQNLLHIVQQTFYLLETDIEVSETIEDKHKAVFVYGTFAMAAASDIKNCEHIHDKSKVYIFFEAMSVLLRTVRNSDFDEVINTCCHFIQLLLDCYLPIFVAEVEYILPNIISSIWPLSHCKEAEAVVEFLTVDKRDILEEAVQKLVCFENLKPTELVFGSMMDEVALFVTILERSPNWKISGLKRIRNVLLSQNVELKALYDKMKTVRCLNEDRSISLFFKFINQLLSLANSHNEEVMQEAMKCLGDLGPVDLTTLVLQPPDTEAIDQNLSSSCARLLHGSLTYLVEIKFNGDYDVKHKCHAALYAVASCQITSDDDASIPAFMHSCLRPFKTSKPSNLKIWYRNDISPPSKQLWIPKLSFDVWISQLADAFLQIVGDSKKVTSCLATACKVHPPFADKIFPLIMDMILDLASNEVLIEISESLNFFFHYCLDHESALTKKCAQRIVQVLDYLRIQQAKISVFKLKIAPDFLLLARVAANCAAHFSSLFYAEQWFESKKVEILSSNRSLMTVTIDDLIESNEGDALTLCCMLRENFVKIGMKDALEGCGSMHLSDPHVRATHLEHIDRWDFSLAYRDIMRDDVGLTQAMDHLGLYHMLCRFPNTDSERKFECATRLSEWSSLVPQSTSKTSFNAHKFLAFKAYHDGSGPVFLNEIANARKAVAQKFKEMHIETTVCLYSFLSQLRQLNELEEFANAFTNNTIDSLRKKWLNDDLATYYDFSLIEPIMSSRTLIVKEGMKRNSDLVNFLGELHFRIIKLARSENKYDVALRNVKVLSDLSDLGLDNTSILKCKIEESRVLYERGETKIGMVLLSQILKQVETPNTLRAKTLRLYGDWMVDTKLENPRMIINKYFLPAYEMANDIDSLASLAKFADSNYMQLREYWQSPIYSERQEIFKSLQNSSSCETGLPSAVTRHFAIDQAEIHNLRKEEKSFLNYAVQYYLMALQGGNKHDRLVFRFVSLWLDNACDDVQTLINNYINRVPSYKFLCLLPQIAPRLAEFPNVTTLLERCIQDHPHHSLPTVFALKNALADRRYDPKSPFHEESKNASRRRKAASELIHNLEKVPHLGKPIRQMAQFTNAIIQFAYYTPREKSLEIPSCQSITSIQNYDQVAFPTVALPIVNSTRYPEIVGVQSFTPSFTLVGGINAPKKVSCLGTDGVMRQMLIKGNDDLRQDAVMQQVFGVMNDLLSGNVDTNRRRLSVRTYRVVPLSMRSGIIEWCSDTMTLGHYLTEKTNGAHVRYHPHELDPREARQKMIAVGSEAPSRRVSVFLQICKEITPVFHYFFIEKFPSTGDWFERRLAYTRSVATTSMIGYILGIGDRHPLNILIDTKTGEVIHIDLGIAFEQGKVLKTPEVVPFRLTRDVEDGMGCSGANGVFRVCCERTMQVMRDNRNTILTLLEVLLYDPLYGWTLTTEKVLKLQDSDSDSDDDDNNTASAVTTTEDSSSPALNVMAERALLRLKTKLMGLEVGGVVSTIEGQVGELIQKAKDPENLGKHFSGWQAYL